MILRNTANQPILLGPLELIADGAAVTSGATIQTRIGGTTASGSGTLTHIASGIWEYIPTQAETDINVLGLLLSGSGARTVSMTVPTTRFPGQTAGVLPVAAAGANGGLPTVDASNRVKANTEQIAGQTANAAAAVTFPASIASPTNITAGTITNVESGVTLAPNQDVRNVGGTLPDVTLAASQPNYAPSKAGDAMSLTIDYDAAKTASQFNASTDPVSISAASGNALVSAMASAITADHGAGSYIRNTEPPAAAAIATAVRAELATELTQVPAIKAKTDNLPADPAGLAALSAAHGAGSWEPIATNTVVAAVAAQITADHGEGSYIRNTEPPAASAIASAVWSTALTETPGVATTIYSALVNLHARSINYRTLNTNTGLATIYAANNTTVLFQYTQSQSGAIQSVSKGI